MRARVRFPGRVRFEPVYFGILITHVILAAAIVPLALLTATAASGRSSISTSESRAGRSLLGLRICYRRCDLPDVLPVLLTSAPMDLCDRIACARAATDRAAQSWRIA